MINDKSVPIETLRKDSYKLMRNKLLRSGASFPFKFAGGFALATYAKELLTALIHANPEYKDLSSLLDGKFWATNEASALAGATGFTLIITLTTMFEQWRIKKYRDNNKDVEWDQLLNTPESKNEFAGFVKLNGKEILWGVVVKMQAAGFLSFSLLAPAAILTTAGVSKIPDKGTTAKTIITAGLVGAEIGGAFEGLLRLVNVKHSPLLPLQAGFAVASALVGEAFGLQLAAWLEIKEENRPEFAKYVGGITGGIAALVPYIPYLLVKTCANEASLDAAKDGKELPVSKQVVTTVLNVGSYLAAPFKFCFNLATGYKPLQQQEQAPEQTTDLLEHNKDLSA